ncbi:MAG TPA: ferric reductase-like transmembrane domain-containing protein [Mycobacteriales bacterium]|nr:ferric reductase-like transmembrane domain-containing protein [Mycobacteriales bacterium]
MTSGMTLWYFTRATAVVGFVLMTMSFALGLAATQRVRESRFWPRFATQHLHRNLAMLSMMFIALHIVSTLADTYVHVGWWSFVVPFVAGYKPLWVALGTLAFDAIVLVIVTSLLRDRLPYRVWRATHWATYALWPLAFVHFLMTGTDATRGRWGLYLDLGAMVLLGAATAARWATRDLERGVAAMPREVAFR